MYALLTYNTSEPRVLFDDETVVLQICYYLSVFIAFVFPSWFFPPFTVNISVPQQLAWCFRTGGKDFLFLLFTSASLWSAHLWFRGRKKNYIYPFIRRDIEGVLPVLTVRGPSPVRETFNYSLWFYITVQGNELD